MFACAAAPSLAAQPKSDWETEQEERNWREGEVVLPAYPQASALIEFQANAAATFRFYVDAASLAVAKEGVVRFTLVARSPTGVENVSYEGLRCKTRTQRTYAFGRPGGQWSPSRGEWRAVESQALQGAPFALWQQFFCPGGIPIGDAAEGVAALRRGGHPHALGPVSLPR